MGGEEGETINKRCTEAQTASALRQAASGTPVAEITRKVGKNEMTFYLRKKQFVDMGVSEIRKLKDSEEENRRLYGIEGLGIRRKKPRRRVACVKVANWRPRGSRCGQLSPGRKK